MTLAWKVGADLTAQNGLYFRYQGGNPAANTLGTFAELTNQAAQTHFKGLHSSSVSLQEVRWEDISSETGAIGTHAGYGVGNMIGFEVAASNCLRMLYHTNRRYRGGKPGGYFPFGTHQTISSPQTWEVAWASSVQTAFTTWIGEILTLGAGSTTVHEHVAVSYYEKGHWVTDPVTERPRYVPKRKEPPGVHQITNWTVIPRIGSQRRRLTGGG
jgi:hypothetical protein